MNTLSLLVIAALASWPDVPVLKDCDPKALPAFEQFAVPIETISAPKLDLSSHPIGPPFRTRLRKAARTQPPNLAGHYLLTEWGCGTGCGMFAIINLRNGRIFHDPGQFLSRGTDTRADSELVVLNAGPSPTELYPPTRFYRWTAGRLEPLCQRFEVVPEQ
jgi:hypothetical protein